jgi:hypothetical protein
MTPNNTSSIPETRNQKMTSTDNFLAGGSSSPAVRFTDIGDKVVGKVLNVRELEDRDPNGETKRWPNGDPKKVFVFELDTDEGAQSLWVRGQMVKAIREAAKVAGVGEMTGCTVAVQFTGLGEAKTKGFAPPKIYKAQVKPAPKSTITADDLLG